MNTSNPGGRRAAALLALQICAAPAVHAADAAHGVFKEQLQKQDGIYQSRGTAVPEGYVIDRSLKSYARALPEDFDRSLARLGPGERWLDIGAGEGRAVIDYGTSNNDALDAAVAPRAGRKAQAVALSIEDRRTAQWHEAAAQLQPEQLKYLFGKRLNEYSAEELGRFEVITDVMGGFSYSTDLSRFMETTLSLLRTQGSFYTVLADVSSEAGGNKPHYPDSAYLTEIAATDGKAVKICAWLKRISCAEVTCEFRPDWTPPIEAYHVKKVCDAVTVPALVPIHYQAGTPPERGYRLRDAWVTEVRRVAEPEPAAVPQRSGLAQ